MISRENDPQAQREVRSLKRGRLTGSWSSPVQIDPQALGIDSLRLGSIMMNEDDFPSRTGSEARRTETSTNTTRSELRPPQQLPRRGTIYPAA